MLEGQELIVTWPCTLTLVNMSSLDEWGNSQSTVGLRAELDRNEGCTQTDVRSIHSHKHLSAL